MNKFEIFGGFVAIIFMAGQLVSQGEAVSLSLEPLSRSEKLAIKKLRLLVRDVLPHEYMKEDLYMLKWLIMKNFSVDNTVPYLKQHVKWRKDKNMDTILREDWEMFETNFPHQLNTFDKEGRPILYIKFGSWDISGSASSGTSRRLVRYFAKLLEDGEVKVRRLRDQGKNLTQFDLIIDLDGYSLSKQGCLQCLGFYSEIGDILQNHYPGAANKIVFVNSPSIFASTFTILSTILDEKIRESIKLIGNDRHAWEPTLLKFIERDQLPGDLY